MILLIDGYNLIFSGLGQATDAKPNQLKVLRDNLVAQLKSYNIRRKYRIIAVFDGDKTVTHYPEEKESGNVRVVFSHGNASADDLIIEIAQSLLRDKPSHQCIGVQGKPRRSDVCAVTSDRALAETLSGHKVKVVSSEEFAAELLLKGKDTAKGLQEDPIEKFTGLKPADVPKWLKLFSEEEHE